MSRIKSATSVVERIREFRNASPFRPYEILTIRGERFRLLESIRLAISPERTEIFFFDRKDRGHVLKASQIKDAKLIRPRKHPRRAA
jgi:hypothetical protein